MQCPTCHQSVLPEYYFCPNCGTKLHEPPLVTDATAKLKLYAHSIILPFLAFISISKWKGMKYLRSEDPSAKSMGQIAMFLLALSTVAVIWYTVHLTQTLMQSVTQGMNPDLEGL